MVDEVEVNKAADGVAPNASDQAPQARPGNPGVQAGSVAQPPKTTTDGKEIKEGDVMVGSPTPNATVNSAPPGAPPIEDKIFEAGSVDIHAEEVDMAGVRVDPITGIAVSQIEAATEDYKKPAGWKPGDIQSIPIQAFDSRKLRGDEKVTVRGNLVMVAGGEYDARKKAEADADDERLPQSIRDEMKAGQEALGRQGKQD